jgi:hypothetical protein
MPVGCRIFHRPTTRTRLSPPGLLDVPEAPEAGAAPQQRAAAGESLLADQPSLERHPHDPGAQLPGDVQG